MNETQMELFTTVCWIISAIGILFTVYFIGKIAGLREAREIHEEIWGRRDS